MTYQYENKKTMKIIKIWFDSTLFTITESINVQLHVLDKKIVIYISNTIPHSYKNYDILNFSTI